MLSKVVVRNVDPSHPSPLINQYICGPPTYGLGNRLFKPPYFDSSQTIYEWAAVDL